jgi:hypothetical protein
MIRICRSSESKGVYVCITPGGHLGQTELDFYRTSASPLETDLLAPFIEQQLHGLFEALRKKYYKAGWRDAKSHKVKQTWFSDYPGLMEWEKKELP